MPNARLAVRVQLCGTFSLEDAARTAIGLAGRLNAPVVFEYAGVDLVVGTADCTSDVIGQYREKRGKAE